ncbi:MAG: outer membrane lipoprotein-sorting protein [Spirochaetota bacterium]
MKLQRSLPAILALCTLAAAPLHAVTGRDVMENVEDRPHGETLHTLVSLDLVSADGEARNRVIETWSMDENDLLRTIVVFHRPASVEGTRFLVRENPDRDDDQWIYLPALKRVRRISASEGGTSFMGTDFTYDDLKTRDLDQDTHTLLGKETFQGRDCHVVESAPVDPKSSQYSRRVQWVPEDIWVPAKIEFYDREGGLLKVYTVHKLDQVQGYWTPLAGTMENVQTGHATRMEVRKLRYNEELDPGLFTTRFLESGRIR